CPTASQNGLRKPPVVQAGRKLRPVGTFFSQSHQSDAAWCAFPASGGNFVCGGNELEHVDVNFVAISVNVPNETAASTPRESRSRRARNAAISSDYTRRMRTRRRVSASSR